MDRSGPSKKAVVGWTLAMLAALGLAWFVGAIGVPAWQVRAVLRKYEAGQLVKDDGTFADMADSLGGPRSAAAKLKAYFRLPAWSWLTGNRYLAMHVLKACGRYGVATLGARLRDGDPYIREIAARGLYEIGPEASETIPELKNALGDSSSSVRLAAATAMTWIDSGTADAVVPVLEELLKDEDKDIRQRAASRLGDLRATRAIGPLVACLADQEWDVRSAAETALSQMGEPAVVPLIAALSSREGDVRYWAAWALGNLGDTRAVVPLIGLLEDENYGVRGRAVESLGELRDPRALGALEPRVNDENGWVRGLARNALEKIKAAESAKDPGSPTVDADLLLRNGFVRRPDCDIYDRREVSIRTLQRIFGVELLPMQTPVNSPPGNMTFTSGLPGGGWLVVDQLPDKQREPPYDVPPLTEDSLVHATVNLKPVWRGSAEAQRNMRASRKQELAAVTGTMREWGPEAAQFLARMSGVRIGWTKAELVAHAGKPGSEATKFDEAMWTYDWSKVEGSAVRKCRFTFFLKGDKVEHFTCEAEAKASRKIE